MLRNTFPQESRRKKLLKKIVLYFMASQALPISFMVLLIGFGGRDILMGYGAGWIANIEVGAIIGIFKILNWCLSDNA